MKKVALLFAAALCFPVIGLTGCGGSGETQVIEAPEEEVVDVSEEIPNYDEEMEKSMNQPGN
jgi:hypothetical protein